MAEVGNERKKIVIIKGIGVDIIEIERVKMACEDNPRFIERVFTEREKKYSFQYKNPYEHLAARFAGKEATFKALGFRVGWKDVEIVNEPSGKPDLFIKNYSDKFSAHISLSHNRTVAVAFVIIEEKI
ncbi:MAG: holo-ACP synthase [Candidatus Aminicenantia bacterium]